MMADFGSSVPQISWPAIPAPYSAALLAVLFQLERSQWQPADALQAEQFRQLADVVAHAYRTVPFYKAAFDKEGVNPRTAATVANWNRLPLLTRRDVQLSGAKLHSTEVPKQHGPVCSMATSGSTNAPVVTLGTEITEFFWRALTLRDHFWHKRDFSRSVAAIRHTGDTKAMPPDGEVSAEWGPATAGTIKTGPGCVLNIQSTIEEQAHWLVRLNPGYVLGYTSALLAVGRLLAQNGQRLSNLLEVRTFGEILEPQCRSEIQRSFGVKVVDMYSSQEVGYIALQCPDHEHYHVQSENLLVEVLDDRGEPCGAGQVGRVVVTTLHNYAMPLLRYDIGDYAEVGEPCACGRGLPVLKRILGRQRNLLTMPDRSRRWPVFDAGERPEELPAFFQFQVIQKSVQQLEILAVRPALFTADEEAHVRRYLQQTLGHPFEISIRCVESIPRSRTGKFEDFISEVG